MENALLVGLSRQMALSHELDVVANNIANVNTTGYKSDGMAFAQFLMQNASDDQFSGNDRRLDFVEDRGTWIDFSPGAIQRTGSPLDVAIDGNAYLAVQTPRGRLQLVGFDQPQRLQKDGGSVFAPPAGVNTTPPPQGVRLLQGSIERSNVNPISEISRMIQITRSYTDIANVLQQQSEQRRNALGQLAQVPSSGTA